MFNLFSRKPASTEELPEIMNKLIDKLLGARKILVGTLSREFKKIDSKLYANVSDELNDFPELDSAFKGYQITSNQGFSTTHNLISLQDYFPFFNALWEKICPNDLSLSKQCNEKYLKCQGDMECLQEMFGNDVIKLMKIPTPSKHMLNILSFTNDYATSFAYQSQVDISYSFGNKKLAKKLIKSFQETRQSHFM